MIIVDQNNRSVELALLLLIKARYPYNKNWYKWNKYNKAKKKKKHEGDVVSPCLFNLLVYQRGIKYFLILGLFESQDSWITSF